MTKFERVNYPGTSEKEIVAMKNHEFATYLNHCKKDMIKAFNISKKFYLYKWTSKSDEESKLFCQLMEIEMKKYLQKKLN